jgi:hypothetical protein
MTPRVIVLIVGQKSNWGVVGAGGRDGDRRQGE